MDQRDGPICNSVRRALSGVSELTPWGQFADPQPSQRPILHKTSDIPHLAEISKVVSPTAHCVLICDGAGWHQSSQRLTIPSNITLLRLPPYAPELNPIENVWEYLRGNYLGHVVWDTYEQILEACCSAWNAFIQDSEKVSSVTTRSWAKVTI